MLYEKFIYLFTSRRYHGSMAQWIRRLPTEQEILGSSPGRVKYFFVQRINKCVILLKLRNIITKQTTYITSWVKVANNETLIRFSIVGKSNTKLS